MTEYERAQLQWMLDHNYSIKDLINELAAYQEEESPEVMQTPINQLFEEWEQDIGFDGSEIWPCEDEWFENQEADEDESDTTGITEEETKNREDLFRLMKENPNLPIVAMVDSEIVADDCCAYWKGSWGSAKIGEYITGNERIHFKDDEEHEEVLEDCASDIDPYSLSEEEAEKAFNNLPWIKAIIVYIDLPNA